MNSNARSGLTPSTHRWEEETLPSGMVRVRCRDCHQVSPACLVPVLTDYLIRNAEMFASNCQLEQIHLVMET